MAAKVYMSEKEAIARGLIPPQSPVPAQSAQKTSCPMDDEPVTFTPLRGAGETRYIRVPVAAVQPTTVSVGWVARCAWPTVMLIIGFLIGFICGLIAMQPHGGA